MPLIIHWLINQLLLSFSIHLSPLSSSWPLARGKRSCGLHGGSLGMIVTGGCKRFSWRWHGQPRGIARPFSCTLSPAFPVLRVCLQWRSVKECAFKLTMPFHRWNNLKPMPYDTASFGVSTLISQSPEVGMTFNRVSCFLDHSVFLTPLSGSQTGWVARCWHTENPGPHRHSCAMGVVEGSWSRAPLCTICFPC
jgi:hypothetical protein